MSGYSIYAPLLGEMVRQASHAFDKKDRKRADFSKRVIQELFKRRPEMLRTLEARILTDEVAWMDAGHPMYFPDSSELLEMLWRAKVDVRIQDLAFNTLPRSFAFSWPECKIEGIQPQGCLIWWGNEVDRLGAVDRFEGHYFGTHHFRKCGPSTLPEDQHFGIHMSTRVSPPAWATVPCAFARASIPENLFQQGLVSDKDFEQCFKTYQNPESLGIIPLTSEEAHIQYVTFKLAMRILVYMRACPEHVREGWPEGRSRRAFEGRWDDFGPRVIGSPARMTMGTHESPIAHLRTWFFRSYPIKKDGTRRDGVVFVRATVVNADVDPMTVEEGGKV